MAHDLPRPVHDAARVLLEACIRAAAERDDVRSALLTLNSWLARELVKTERSGRHTHGVLTPHTQGSSTTRDIDRRRGRDDEDEVDGDGDAGSRGRITDPLRVVVTRARWKAAACRLALDRRDASRANDEEGGAAHDQLAARERSLRTRLQGLADTSAWMLDLPFGTRISEPGAFEVADEQADRLRLVAECYEVVALGAETAIDLDENGAFRSGPVPSFLYLLAEAQSALLHSLQDAPTRNDSDQRDMFLWLKEQTTRYRIYVDRHMRLDDPADVRGSQDLTERMKRSAREILDARKVRRERGQVLNKLRYHVRKLLDGGPLNLSEIDSLGAAIERWRESGNALDDRALVELVQSLRVRHLADGSDTSEVVERLRVVLADVPTTATARGGPARDARRSRTSGRSPLQDVPTRAESGGREADRRAASGSVAARDEADEERVRRMLAEVAELLEKRRVVLFAPDVSVVDADALAESLGAEGVDAVGIDVNGERDERIAALEAQIEDESKDLLLLGIRLGPDEYQSFKEACLAAKKPFVRLPGAFAPAAVAHQIMRQVGWRLRALRDQTVR